MLAMPDAAWAETRYHAHSVLSFTRTASKMSRLSLLTRIAATESVSSCVQIEKLTAQLKEQAEQIRKINDEVEMNRTAPQIVVNDQ
jgi:TolA-binding protein